MAVNEETTLMLHRIPDKVERMFLILVEREFSKSM